MTESTKNYKFNFIELASELIAAYVSNNSIPVAELPNLIHGVHAALTGLSSSSSHGASQEEVIDQPTAAQIRKSVTPHGLVSFIDGKSYKTLKRHLSAHGLDPQSYRQRYGLSADYPMVCTEYASQRSELAKAIGLGRIQAAAASEPAEEKLQPKAGRRKKEA